jgi:hypothetical protein
VQTQLVLGLWLAMRCYSPLDLHNSPAVPKQTIHAKEVNKDFMGGYDLGSVAVDLDWHVLVLLHRTLDLLFYQCIFGHQQKVCGLHLLCRHQALAALLEDTN